MKQETENNTNLVHIGEIATVLNNARPVSVETWNKPSRAIKLPSKMFACISTIICLLCLTKGAFSLCEIASGENVVIIEIPESLGSQTNQSTIPGTLPITGSEDEISLSIQSETHRYFRIKDKTLHLIRPLDRDEQGLTSIYLQVSCLDRATSAKKSVPVLVKVVDINDNIPQFLSNEYEAQISESAPVGTIVYRDLIAKDADSGSNGLIEYSTITGDGGQNDGYDYFEIKMPHQGLVTVKKPLDFEHSSLYYLKVKATDKAGDPTKRLTTSTVLTIRVTDADDLPPTFHYDGCQLEAGKCRSPIQYKAIISSGAPGGNLRLLPAALYAYDQDSLNSPIVYSFLNGTPMSYGHYFQVDPKTGIVKQLRPVDRSFAKYFDITLKAEQVSAIKRFATAKLRVDVLPVDRSPPVLVPSSYHGYVNENSPIGATVTSDKEGGQPLRIMVTDADIASDDIPAIYVFETTTNAFKVNSQGFLLVNEAGLDRDAPNPSTYTFQVVARQAGTIGDKGGSAPVTLNVHLKDLNDNPPKLPNFSPVQVQAGDGVKPVTRVIARDVDEVDKGQITYSIHHVSNNGKEKFRIDAETGQIESIGKVIAGEQYSLTIQAMDSRNMRSQSILDIVIVPGPNSGGPVFGKERYELEVSEGVSPYSSVVTLKATDPENDHIVYSIVGGNVNDDFIIDQHSGILTVAKRLDREEVSSYNLIIKAMDRGGLSGLTTVSITVTDVNDENPQFLQDNYLFRVEEGEPGAFVGSVAARDADIGENGQVAYALSDQTFFRIDSATGDIYTSKALDFEKQKLHRLVVTAQDGGANSRLSTASVTIEVLDAQDELPYFERTVMEASVEENKNQAKVGQVKAHDPDSVPSITYIIREGDLSLFSVDPITGTIYTTQGLDYEKRNHYTLVIGTMENDSTDPRAICTLKISVVDQNDNPPIFTSAPMPIRLQDSVPLGTVVTNLNAVDGDGTSANNQIRYEISGKGKAPKYFFIDSTNGIISVKDDLKKEPESEYRIMVKASDSGSPPLTSTTMLTVYVEHIATIASDSGLGFAEGRYTLEIEENLPANSIVKSISVINKPRGNFPMSCELIAGNEANAFYVVENDHRDCEIKTRQSLDYEMQSKYSLTLKLNAIGGVTGVSRLITQVSINVIDLNDNRPQFVIPQRYASATGNRYLAAVSSDAPADSEVIQVVASDDDSLTNGAITYEIVSQTDPEGRFKIDPVTGILRISRSLEDILQTETPMKVAVVARDNPSIHSSSLSTTVEVVINIIEDKHRFGLVLKDTSASRVHDMKDSLIQLLQDRTGMLAGWEKAESLKLLRNNSIESDVTGTDVWLYLVEPASLRILDAADLRVSSPVFEETSQYALVESIASNLGLHADHLRHPYTKVLPLKPSIVPVAINTDINDLGAALILLATMIAIFGVIGIIYQCSMWSKFLSKREMIKHRIRVPTPSRYYEPIYIEPSLKEYETQVLQMSVNIDDDGSLDGRTNARKLVHGYLTSSCDHQRATSSESPVDTVSNSLSATSTTNVLKNRSQSPSRKRNRRQRNQRQMKPSDIHGVEQRRRRQPY